ncbi:DNA polymerase IV [Desulfoluna sp.]|uniref:DNA polymerase IV n=1 Tax=Desulfoluna sp. TaxID=2045199 RepID=UPI0026230792|nr:DNA polymerase IV [Desulfoluna sp.]
MILHLDMDAFFAAVEQLDNPALRGKPVVVSGHSARSVVSTASYEARQYGVHSAMPLFQALKLCPHACVVPGNRRRYQEISAQVFAICREYSPLVEQVSIDEGYLDVTGCEGLFGSPVDMAQTLRQRVAKETGLTCSVGVAPVKFVAKVASDLNKPNGVYVVTPESLDAFLVALPVKKVPGAGKRTVALLDELGIRTLGDMRRFPLSTFTQKLGQAGERLYALAYGRDAAGVSGEPEEAKSISCESTLEKDTTDPAFVYARLLAQADEVAGELRRKGLFAKRVTLKLTFADFRRITRQTTLTRPTHLSGHLYAEAVTLFDREWTGQRIRLVGLGCSQISHDEATPPSQLDLFGQVARQEVRDEGWEKVEQSVDAIREKFGKYAVTRARVKK